MQLKENNGKINNTRKNFFKGIKKERVLDGRTFDIWKTELQNNLNTFWESFSDTGRR